MRHWQLGMAIVWTSVAVGLFFRDWWLPEERAAQMQGQNWTVSAGVAAVFAAWNLARWTHARPARRAEQPPLQPRRAEDTPYEYNPELDFGRPELATDHQKQNTDQKQAEG